MECVWYNIIVSCTWLRGFWPINSCEKWDSLRLVSHYSQLRLSLHSDFESVLWIPPLVMIAVIVRYLSQPLQGTLKQICTGFHKKQSEIKHKLLWTHILVSMEYQNLVNLVLCSAKNTTPPWHLWEESVDLHSHTSWWLHSGNMSSDTPVRFVL